MQGMFKEKENVFEECLLDSDENGSEEEKVEPIVYNNPDYGFDENDDSE